MTMHGSSWHCTGDRDQDHPQEKEMQKSKMAVWGGLQIAVKRREVKSKGEKERYKHMNAEFQRKAWRGKKAFFSDQCQEIEENNRMGAGAPPVAKVMRKEARHTQRRDWASGIPLEILEHLPPKTRVCLLSALCSHLHLWLYGGLSPTTSLWKRVNLQLQLIIPGCDSVSNYKLLWKSSSLPQ